MNSGKCLDVYRSGTGEHVNVQQWACHSGSNQLWRKVISSDGEFEIVSVHSGKCLEVRGRESNNNGANVQQFSCHGGTNQKWKAVYPHRLVSQSTRECATIEQQSQANGANLILETCHSGSDHHRDARQLWFFDHLNPDEFRIVSTHSGKCLDTLGGLSDVFHEDCQDVDQQCWKKQYLPDGSFRIMSVDTEQCLGALASDIIQLDCQYNDSFVQETPSDGSIYLRHCKSRVNGRCEYAYIGTNRDYEIHAHNDTPLECPLCQDRCRLLLRIFV